MKAIGVKRYGALGGRRWLTLALVLLLPGPLRAAPAPGFTLVTYNVENYLLEPRGTRPAKSAAARAAICEGLRRLEPDVVALQEIGDTNALLDLQRALRSAGLDLPHAAVAGGFDTNIQVAVLSRWPFRAVDAHEEAGFLLRGRRFRPARAFLEVDIEPAPGFRCTLINAHLKSRRESGSAPQDELREQEALLLRQLVDRRLQQNPQAYLAVLGDFNDVRDSRPLRLLLGRGRTALVDTRPEEAAPTAGEGERRQGRGIAWTHHYAKEDVYSRVDYILLTPALGRHWQSGEARVGAWSDWDLASDHRPLSVRLRVTPAPGRSRSARSR